METPSWVTSTHARRRASLIAGLTMAGALTLSLPALAQEGDEGQAAETDAAAEATSAPQGTPWLQQHRPEPHMVEAGFYTGFFWPADDIELFKVDEFQQELGFKPFEARSPDFGLRLGYFPLEVAGVELDAGFIPTNLEDGADATIWTVRGHLVGQLPFWRIVPFGTIGVGAIGVSSDADVVGNNVDRVLTLGFGAKLYVNRFSYLRVDFRDNISAKAGGPGATQSAEVLFGLGLTFGRAPEPAPEPAPVTEEPPPPPDTDGDGITDDKDQCPQEPETVNEVLDEDGCPEGDRDRDGVLDPLDQCPDEAGTQDDGCPIPDSDGDGLLDPQDKCPKEPETRNGFEDEDGCPDELPQAVKEFTGAIEGIKFATGSDRITPASRATLDKAVEVLVSYEALRLRIIGHTDNVGNREDNVELSRKRAESVKAYMVDKGIAADRLEALGMGPESPVADNKTPQGRAQNRRIEFELIRQVRGVNVPGGLKKP